MTDIELSRALIFGNELEAELLETLNNGVTVKAGLALQIRETYELIVKKHYLDDARRIATRKFQNALNEAHGTGNNDYTLEERRR